VLRRQVSRPRFRPADRALIAALARLLPRERWVSLIVCPATVRRWHRNALARRWTYPRHGPGRPPVEAAVAELIVRLARENPTWPHQQLDLIGELAPAAQYDQLQKATQHPVAEGHDHPSILTDAL